MQHSALAAPRRIAAVVAFLAVMPLTALASGPRTFVASYGDDANACTMGTPCRTLQRAISAVDPGGSVIVLDAAGYGPATIAKSVSIVAARGIYAGISVMSGVGLDVSGAGIKVSLEGLTLAGVGAGTSGVRFTAGAELRMARCTVTSMTDAGLVATAPGGNVFVGDTTFQDNYVGANFEGVSGTLARVQVGSRYTGGPGVVVGAQAAISIREATIADNFIGIDVHNTAGSSTALAVDSSLLAGNGQGVIVTASGAGSTVSVGIAHSSIVNSAVDGVVVDATAPAAAVVTLTANVIADHYGDGVRAQNSGAMILATGNTIARNRTGGLVQVGGATLQSLGNNSIDPPLPTVGTVTPVAGY